MPRLNDEELSDVSSETKEIIAGAEDSEEIPETVSTPKKDAKTMIYDEDDDDDYVKDFDHDDKPEVDAGGDDEDDAEIYEVEVIRNHKKVRGQILYEVKWKGYTESENTFEPESNILPSAREALAAYHKLKGMSLTSQPASTKGKKGRGANTPLATRRKNSETADDSDSGAPPSKKARSAADASPDSDALVGTWLPKGNDWEKHVNCVQSVQKDKDGQLIAYMLWNNGKKTKVSINQVHEKCPRPLLRFYEKHLAATNLTPSPDPNSPNANPPEQ